MDADDPNDKQYTDSAGRAQAIAPGPRGQRMMQLGILTKAQKKKPVMPQVRMNGEGQPHPGDMENLKAATSLAQQAYAQKMATIQQGAQNTIPERNPMKTSMYRTPMFKSR